VELIEYPPITLADLEEAFKRHDWRYEIVENHLLTGFNGVPMIFSVEEEREVLLLQVPLVPGKGMAGYRPVQPEAERDACMYLMSVNYRLILGSYTRDHRDGEVRYEISVPLVGSFLSDEQLEHAILVAGSTVTLHAPVINALLTRQITLQQALALLERGHNMSPPVAV
jgi:hypothetical protein